jgi:hypothetical protein
LIVSGKLSPVSWMREQLLGLSIRELSKYVFFVLMFACSFFFLRCGLNTL